MAVTKIEVQDYTDTLVRIVLERGEEPPVALQLPRGELPAQTVQDGKLRRDRAQTDALIRALIAEHGHGTVPDELVIEYASGLRVAEPEPAAKKP